MPIYALGPLLPQIHPDAYVHPDAVIIGEASIGAQPSVWPAVLRADFGRIVIGERTSILRAGSVVGAKALVPEGLDLPANHMALGIPARVRPIDPGKQGEWMDVAVRMYTDNAKHYRHGLRRIDQEENPNVNEDVQGPQQSGHRYE